MSDASTNLDFRAFESPNYWKMPEMVAAGLVPAGAAQIMRGRLEGKLLFDRYHDSGDAIIYYPDNGSVKLVWDSEDLRKLDMKSSLSSTGALILPDGAFESIDGKVFSRDGIEECINKRQFKSQARGNPFWQWLARDDQALLDEYADEMFGRVKWRYSCDEAMGVYLGNLETDAPVLRLWCLGGVGDSSGNAYGYDHLGINNWRMVGVEALEAHSPKRV